MARKSAIEPKTGQLPGYSEAGFTPRGADMETQVLLSLFPGIDLLGRAFEEHGFCIVRGPDLLWGGDIRAFHPPPGRFDGVVGGPPCQTFSQFRHLYSVTGGTPTHQNLHRAVGALC